MKSYTLRTDIFTLNYNVTLSGTWTAKVKAWQDKEEPKIAANKAKIAARRASLEKAFTNVRGERGEEVESGVGRCCVLWLWCVVVSVTNLRQYHGTRTSYLFIHHKYETQLHSLN